MKVFVRHNPTHAVTAEVTPLQGRKIRMDGIRPAGGPRPKVGHLIGKVFPSVKDLRRSLVAAMKGMVGDDLDHVLLSCDAYQAWEKMAVESAQQAVAEGVVIDPASIPDERVKPIEGGGLLIWVDIPGWRRVEMVIPKGQWAWRKRPKTDF